VWRLLGGTGPLTIAMSSSRSPLSNMLCPLGMSVVCLNMAEVLMGPPCMVTAKSMRGAQHTEYGLSFHIGEDSASFTAVSCLFLAIRQSSAYTRPRLSRFAIVFRHLYYLISERRTGLRLIPTLPSLQHKPHFRVLRNPNWDLSISIGAVFF
jgi:hypothetical protein